MAQNLVLRTFVLVGPSVAVEAVVEELRAQASEFQDVTGEQPPVMVYEQTRVGVDSVIRADVYKLNRLA